MDTFSENKKKNKNTKTIIDLTKKINGLSNHIHFLHSEKLISNEQFQQVMSDISFINAHLLQLEYTIEIKKPTKGTLDSIVEKIYNDLEDIVLHHGTENIISVLETLLFNNDNFFNQLDNTSKENLILYNEFFCPLSVFHLSDEVKVGKAPKKENSKKNMKDIQIEIKTKSGAKVESSKVEEQDYVKSNTLPDNNINISSGNNNNNSNNNNNVNNKNVSNSKVEQFEKAFPIGNKKNPIVFPLLNSSKKDLLYEKIEGASIIFKISPTEIIYVNGFFKKDPLNICRKHVHFEDKTKYIQDELEYSEIPEYFQKRALEQVSLRDFIMKSPTDIAFFIKEDYKDFVNSKKKPLAVLIKEFMKMPIEQQRRLILLFLIGDETSQFTAHIIYDLINEQSFTNDSQSVADIIFKSFDWRLQKLFKSTKQNVENQKKKIQSLSVSDIPYESRIMMMNAPENVKAKAMEKIKEVGGSKESSIKAQQWLDGLLKIPFGTYKKEPIIEFFHSFQNKIEKYVDILSLKMIEVDVESLNYKNKNIYQIMIEIINEYNAITYKSENAYDKFIVYIKTVIRNVQKEIMNHPNLGSILDELRIKSMEIKPIKKMGKLCIANEPFSDEEYGEHVPGSTLINQLDSSIDIPDEETIDKCVQQLNHFKHLKKELVENKFLNENNIETMTKKLCELEEMLGLNNTNQNSSLDDNIFCDVIDVNHQFLKFVFRNLEEWSTFLSEWEDFKSKKTDYIKQVDKILDKCTFGQNDAKKQMKRIIGQWMNGVSKGQCIGLCGPPGVGKTTLCKNGLAKCLFDEKGESRPFAFLPLGGATNGSILEGHHYTYLGSTWGKIVDIIMETKCMNPIIYIDELDKISKTEHGKEIASILTHITDQSQNKEFYDRYFSSIPIDLSQVLFIFSYNDRDSVDRILRDRIQEIHIKPLTTNEKLIISQNYILPEIYSNVGFSEQEILFDDELIRKIIEDYTYEPGIRKCNEILYDVIRDLNLEKIMGNYVSYPIVVSDMYLKEFLSNYSKIHKKKICIQPVIGLVNGLYATDSGMGGLTIIQVVKTMSEKKFDLDKLTGNQGDVMKESMSCALTLAKNILPKSVKKELLECKENFFGLHIHCPEAATPKDGPSAGLAITTAILSVLVGIPIRNTVAMTGEVDLFGNACEIGGLYSKIQGAYNAGATKVLIPRENEKDLDLIFKKEEEEKTKVQKHLTRALSNSNLLEEDENIITDDNKRMFRNTVEIVLVDSIYDVLKHAFVEHSYEFERLPITRALL